MERAIDYSMIGKKNHYALSKWRRQIGFAKKIVQYVVLLAQFW